MGCSDKPVDKEPEQIENKLPRSIRTGPTACNSKELPEFLISIDSIPKALHNSEYQDSVEYYNYLGGIHLERKEPELALQAYLKAINCDSTVVYSFSNLAIAYNTLGLYEKAIKSISKADDICLDHFSSRAEAGYSYLMLEEFDQAENQLNMAHKMEPTNIPVIGNLFKLYISTEQNDSLVKWLNYAEENFSEEQKQSEYLDSLLKANNVR